MFVCSQSTSVLVKQVNLTCRNASVVDFCLSNVHFLERLVDFEILEFSTLFSDVHTPFTLTLKIEHSHCEDADPDVIPNESFTEKVKKWEQEKSSIIILILIN